MIAGLLIGSLFVAQAQDAGDLKRDMRALEIFLQDQEDHEEFCPKLKWEQPDISIYKKKLESQLPEGCKE